MQCNRFCCFLLFCFRAQLIENATLRFVNRQRLHVVAPTSVRNQVISGVRIVEDRDTRVRCA